MRKRAPPTSRRLTDQDAAIIKGMPLEATQNTISQLVSASTARGLPKSLLAKRSRMSGQLQRKRCQNLAPTVRWLPSVTCPHAAGTFQNIIASMDWNVRLLKSRPVSL